MTKRIEGNVLMGWDGIIKGQIIKFTKKISFLGDINPQTSKPISKLDPKRRAIAKKILFFPGSKGSTVGSAVLYGLAKRQKAPKLLVTLNSDLVTLGGAIFGEIPTMKISKTAFDQVQSNQKAKAYIQKEKGIIEMRR